MSAASFSWTVYVQIVVKDVLVSTHCRLFDVCNIFRKLCV